MVTTSIVHISNPTAIYKVYLNTDKIVVESGTEDALVFVVKYINYYNTEDEIPPPEHPLLDNIELKDLFELEAHIFGDLLEVPITEKNKMFIKALMQIAIELNIKTLLKKLAAILAYNMLNQN
jgi:hypothetical protein